MSIRILTLFVFALPVMSCHQTDKLFTEARALDSLQQYKEAIALYDQILAEEPDHFHALFYRASDKYLTGDSLGQVNDLQTILKLDSTNTLAFFNLGVAYANMERYEESIAAFHGAERTKGTGLTIKIVPNAFLRTTGEENIYDIPYEEIKLERGIVYYKVDSLRKAYYDLTYCVNSKYELKESYYFRGMTYLRSGMHEQGCEDLKMSELYGDLDATAALEKYCRKTPSH